jgi:hypothetical protein
VSGAVAIEPAALFGLDPASYRRHWLHGGERTYPETNCYTDLLIELVHARGDEPLAILGSTVRLDFETDQWTFFKPHPEDLEAILGLDIHEVQPYRSLPAQVADTIADGRTLTIEVDAWYLPDTAATSYHRDHVKTTIAVEAIDRTSERLAYFHNTSLFALDGADYRGLFRIDPRPSGDALLPYVELVRFAGRRAEAGTVREAAMAATRRHLDRLAAGNPVTRFGDRLREVLPSLLEGDEADYHAYAFATVRMAGAGFDLLAAHVDWLLGESGGGVSSVLGRIVEGSKLLGFKLARRRAFDPDPTIADMAAAWSEAMGRLDDGLAPR